ncbi:MAG TPA: class I SAM-dependent methyltransferase [Tahibacter sp.]|nr:class I SAM-dependent methyltransferase [Tahibacter sp.]
MSSVDRATAEAFATSWNNLPSGSVYTREQFEEWMAPLTRADVEGRSVLELGCGNGSLLVHCCSWQPQQIVGVDLGSSVEAARRNVALSGFERAEIRQGDLIEFRSEGFDLAYCIGVLHHLDTPKEGFDAVVRNSKPGGNFHCWVYAREGNGIIVWVVDPIRKIASKLPWWFNKYLIATPLVVPYFFYAKAIRLLHRWFPRAAPKLLSWAPLREYSLWIAERGFLFFRHVAFDQLVTPQTVYISRKQVDEWLSSSPDIEPSSTYAVFRNGNSWKFGGKRKAAAP